EPNDSANGELRRFELGPLPSSRTRLLGKDASERAFDLDEAEVVVAAGAGLGDADVEELRGLAPPGAALGGDRGACEAGLIPRSRQLGLLGRSVAPRL